MTRYDTDRDALERDCDVEFFIASGPGGQHRNKTATGVRLRHRPSGIVVTATERRSQSANREMAFERMAQRLDAANYQPTPRRPTRPSIAKKRERLDQKRQRARIKQARRRVSDE
jgi:protein subunit release factor B